uniref:Guanine nucleotide-binding protein alpha-3 subunit n=1 Tax=Parastrongyloides trichosuri TaxID=131310 RepID=A0A0N4ZK77_PARTI
MGLCHSEEEKEQGMVNKDIEKKLKESKIQDEKTIKLLLLGAGECGKSTVMKQMKILHNNGFTEDELNQQKSVVFSNTLNSMVLLIKAMNTYKVGYTNPDSEAEARVIMDVVKKNEESEPFTKEVYNALKVLWSDTSINSIVYEKRMEFHLQDSAKYFLDSLDRLAASDYKPTETDILLTRIKTTGIVEVIFKIKSVNFRVFDVGGQRSERKKWIHCFENVNAIIFVTAVSEYDEVLFEDETTNRMTESMRLFESICNSRWFISTSMILFLNKKDLFAEKIKRVSIRILFPEYNGEQNYDESIAYIKNQFEQVNTNPKKVIYVHQTCATDTNQVQLILDSVVSMVIQANLHKSGLY